MSALRRLAREAVDAGLAGSAILDRAATVLACAGAIDEDDARKLVAMATRQLTDEATPRTEIVEVALNGTVFHVGLAARRVFVVALLGSASRDLARFLRQEVENVVHDLRGERPPAIVPSTDGGSSSGPAELQLVELGLTVPRAKA